MASPVVTRALRIQTGRFEERIVKVVLKMLKRQEGCTMIRSLKRKMGGFTASLSVS